jgi:hypothetical protein
MSDDLFPDLETQEPPPTPGYSWRGYGKSVHRRHELELDGEPVGVVVRHCGHPTALRPWYCEQIDGTAFQYVATAREYALAQHTGLDWPAPNHTRGVVARNHASPIPDREYIPTKDELC